MRINDEKHATQVKNDSKNKEDKQPKTVTPIDEVIVTKKWYKILNRVSLGSNVPP